MLKQYFSKPILYFLVPLILIFPKYSHSQESKLEEKANPKISMAQEFKLEEKTNSETQLRPSRLYFQTEQNTKEKELCMQQWKEFDKTNIMPTLFESYSNLEKGINESLDNISNIFGKDAKMEVEGDTVRLFFEIPF